MTDRGLSSRNSFPKLDDKTPEDKKTTANPKGGRCWRMRHGGQGVGGRLPLQNAKPAKPHFPALGYHGYSEIRWKRQALTCANVKP